MSQRNRFRDIQGGGGGIEGCVIHISQSISPGSETDITAVTVVKDSANLSNGSGGIVIAEAKVYTIMLHLTSSVAQNTSTTVVGFKGMIILTRGGVSSKIAQGGLPTSSGMFLPSVNATCERYLEVGDIISSSMFHNFTVSSTAGGYLSVGTLTRSDV